METKTVRHRSKPWNLYVITPFPDSPGRNEGIPTKPGILRMFSDDDLSFPKEYLIQYIISAHIGITSKWLEGGMKYSPSYLAELLTHLTFQGVFHGLELDKIIELPK